MASLLPPEPKACPICYCPMHVATDEGQTFYICPVCLNTWVRADPYPFRLGESLQSTPQAQSVRVVPETCGLTDEERATSDRLLRLALGE